jgi:cell division protein FtsI (penicillin-binding protein 3)
LARRTIGRLDEQGEYGIEALYRDQLAGKDGIEWRQRIAHGFSGRVAGHAGNIDPEDGADVVTTLASDVQDVADKALKAVGIALIPQDELYKI